MRHTLQTKLVVALIGAAGLATAASAQFATKAEPKSKSTTTVVVTNDEGSYEIKIEDGKLYKVVVDGEKVDPELCELDQEGGFVVIHRDGEPIVVDIPTMAGGFGMTAPLAVTGGRTVFPGQNKFTVKTPEPIQWAEEPAVPAAPGNIFYDDGKVSWAGSTPPKVMVGITHDEVNDKLRQKFDLDEGEGIYVIEVREGLPASKAGIKSGDIIIEAGGEHVDERSVLVEVLKEKKPGDKLEVIVLRSADDGDIKKKKLRVNLAEYDSFALSGNRAFGIADAPEFKQRFGLTVDEIEPEFNEKLELEFFDDFDFEFPEEFAEMEPEVRIEIERALEAARQQAQEARARVFKLRDGQVRALERQSQAHERAMRQHFEHQQRHAEELEKHRESIARHQGRVRVHDLDVAEIEKLKEHGLAQLLSKEDAKKLQEHGITLDLDLEEDLERLMNLELKINELGDNQQLIRVHPEGRAFLIEREAAERERERADRRDERDNQFFEIRTERDELRDRNRELEHRVNELERKLEMLMRKLEKSQ
ncbi:MAG: hypothetical protein Phyf2KO_27400 [Phycisphaerales bacterium]